MTTSIDADQDPEQLLRDLVQQLADAQSLASTLRDECSTCRKQIQFAGSHTATDRYLLPAWRDGDGWGGCSGGKGHVPTHNKPGR